MMSEQAKEARREYKRKWAKQNPDKVRATTARYWEKVAREAAEKKAAAQEQENGQGQAAAA